MSLDAAIRLLDRLEHGAKESRELYGVCGKAAVLDDAEELGWVTVGDVVAITVKGRRALDGARRWGAICQRFGADVDL